MSTEQAYINGFVKRAAEYGFSKDNALELLKAAEEEMGPFDAERAADMMAAELKLKALAHNKKEHPYHYYLNPFVGGPLTEGITRLHRRGHAGMADDEILAHHLLGGPFLNMYRGGEDTRDKVREKFNKAIGDYSPEGEV
jgi:hypothetical protein